jgi:hypothetical protein
MLRTLPCAVFGAVLTLCVQAAPAHAERFEDAVLAELNYARGDPAGYARDLRDEGPDPYGWEDPAAVAEAAAQLSRQAPLAPLRPDPRLAAAARSHAAAQGRSGGVGHGRSDDGLGPRLRSHGVFAGLAAENIAYGQETPRDVVRQLIVDSRVPGRGHRRDVFSAGYQLAGVACAPHPTYGMMCVIDYAGGMAPE